MPQQVRKYLTGPRVLISFCCKDKIPFVLQGVFCHCNGRSRPSATSFHRVPSQLKPVLPIHYPPESSGLAWWMMWSHSLGGIRALKDWRKTRQMASLAGGFNIRVAQYSPWGHEGKTPDNKNRTDLEWGKGEVTLIEEILVAKPAGASNRWETQKQLGLHRWSQNVLRGLFESLLWQEGKPSQQPHWEHLVMGFGFLSW